MTTIAEFGAGTIKVMCDVYSFVCYCAESTAGPE